MRLIDLFAGCGGLTEGFTRAGFEPVMAVENNPHAAATYEANFGPHVRCEDIAFLRHDEFPAAEIVVGGPPCQGFSNLGRQDPDDPRNELWKEYMRVVETVRPKLFVLENVPRFLKSDQFALLRWAVDSGSLQEYSLHAQVVSAADYGVPQKRVRAIVIGSRVSEPSMANATHGKGSIQQWVGVQAALEGIPFETVGLRLPDRETETGIPGIFKAPEIHLGRNPSATSLLRYDQIPPGGNRFDLPDELKPACWLNKKTGTSDVMGRLEWDKPALTIRTEFWKPEKGRSLHPQWDANDSTNRVNRPITHWEAARIQTFPDDFVWCGTKVEIARQIGNAVPPRLAEAIARHVAERLL